METTRVNSNFCIGVTLLSQATTFIGFGITLASLNPITSVLNTFVNESYQIRHGKPASQSHVTMVMTVAQSMLVVGAFLGAAITKLTLRSLSRRNNLLLIHLLVMFASIITGPVSRIFRAYETLMVGRAFSGMAIGLGYGVAPIFVAETVHRSTISTYQSPVAWLMRIGQILGNGLGNSRVLGSESHWPLLVALPGVLSLFFLAAFYWIPNTPAMVIRSSIKSRGRESDVKALRLLRRMRCGSDKTVETEKDEISEEIEADEAIDKASLWKILSDGAYRRQLAAAVIVVCSVQFTGSQAVILYTDAIFIAGGVPPEYANYASMATFGIALAISFLVTPILKRLGSRRMLLAGLSVSTSSLVTLVVSTVTKDRYVIMPFVSMTSVVTYIVGVSIGPLLVFMSLMTELTTQTTRPNAVWLSGLAYWTTGSLVAFTTPYLLEAIGGYAYLPFVFLSLLEMAYVAFMVPETRLAKATDLKDKFKRRRLSSASRKKSINNNIKEMDTLM